MVEISPRPELVAFANRSNPTARSFLILLVSLCNCVLGALIPFMPLNVLSDGTSIVSGSANGTSTMSAILP